MNFFKLETTRSTLRDNLRLAPTIRLKPWPGSLCRAPAWP
jgi:hypothetical protein